MGKRKRKLTSKEKAAKKRRGREYMTIFINGKQKRVKRPAMIEGLPVEEFIRRNADPVWLAANGMYEELEQRQSEQCSSEKEQPKDRKEADPFDQIPF